MTVAESVVAFELESHNRSSIMQDVSATHVGLRQLINRSLSAEDVLHGVLLHESSSKATIDSLLYVAMSLDEISIDSSLLLIFTKVDCMNVYRVRMHV